MYWIFSSLSRAPSLAIGFVLAHVTVIIWKAFDKGYLAWAKWTAENILTPVHHGVVRFVDVLWPQFTIFVGNSEPTAAEAPHVYYAMLTVLFAWLIRAAVRFLSSLVFHRESRSETYFRI